MSSSVLFGSENLTMEDIYHVAKSGKQVSLSTEPSFVDGINRGRQFLEELLQADGHIYGVTTGFGDSCTTTVPSELVAELPLQLLRFHQCGLGTFLTQEQTRAVMAVRLASLCKGRSGVRYQLLQQLETFLNLNINPCIPAEGSVGASGDLTPLSYVAAALVGEGNVTFEGRVRSSAEVLRELNIEPIVLAPKEGLAIMNGTAVMTGLACLAFERAKYLCKVSSRLTSMMSVAMQGNSFHFDEALFAAKPHPGMVQVAQWIRSDLGGDVAPANSHRLQDRYSLRCSPHVIGVLQDALNMLRSFIEIELNSTNDNPLIDVDQKKVLHGGHFYGGHIAFAMDSLKTVIANVADLVDRQIASLVDPKFNNGLPANLVGTKGQRASISHGFKAVQIASSAWTAEALKLTMPASVFSRSTECHNQDKVSMGTIASRDCLRVLELTEQVVAAGVLSAHQGLKLRQQEAAPAISDFVKELDRDFGFIEHDQPLDGALRRCVDRIQDQQWTLYT